MASKISILKDIYFENRFIYNKLEAILFEEMRRIGLLLVYSWQQLSASLRSVLVISEYFMFNVWRGVTACMYF
jgi:hypothetical protein